MVNELDDLKTDQMQHKSNSTHSSLILVHPDCKSSNLCSQKIDTLTKLITFMTILQYSLHLGIMGWITNTSMSTQSRMFVAWLVFLV